MSFNNRSERFTFSQQMMDDAKKKEEDNKDVLNLVKIILALIIAYMCVCAFKYVFGDDDLQVPSSVAVINSGANANSNNNVHVQADLANKNADEKARIADDAEKLALIEAENKRIAEIEAARVKDEAARAKAIADAAIEAAKRNAEEAAARAAEIEATALVARTAAFAAAEAARLAEAKKMECENSLNVYTGIHDIKYICPPKYSFGNQNPHNYPDTWGFANSNKQSCWMSDNIKDCGWKTKYEDKTRQTEATCDPVFYETPNGKKVVSNMTYWGSPGYLDAGNYIPERGPNNSVLYYIPNPKLYSGKEYCSSGI
jgi:nucleoid-associated protein YgaU